MGELRRVCIIDELHNMQFYESRDKRPLNSLSLQELELERIRLPEVAYTNKIKQERGGATND
ncbi:hypothetical protein FLK61_35270 [Paenalkalicoccus suaedae]|uniref:Fur-regulated basic protein FbpA n=1 Tax=Paenalkalicoccus suaedae TaxID=2592382 RepID=A0A859FGI9_9BACI|nr:hypothetical protein [Paenalkalicoccus suaedae]QKS71930.1 hypothetical protein FLK61_35270 [Paenalkalicoccus suaedae]